MSGKRPARFLKSFIHRFKGFTGSNKQMSNVINIIGASSMAERMIPSIDNRLVNWAEYIDREQRGELGGKVNMIAVLIDGQGDMTRSTVPYSGMPDAIYDTDSVMRKLDETQPSLAQVVREHYQNASALPEQRYIACGISESTYYRRLGQAHHAVLFLLKGGKVTTSRAQITVRQMRKAG